MSAAVDTEIGRHASDPLGGLPAAFATAAQRTGEPRYRGCPYINAAAEYPDAAHPVRSLIAEHRAWLRDRFTALLAAAGHPRPEESARTLVLLWDGCFVGGYFDSPTDIQAALTRAVQAVMRPANGG